MGGWEQQILTAPLYGPTSGWIIPQLLKHLASSYLGQVELRSFMYVESPFLDEVPL